MAMGPWTREGRWEGERAGRVVNENSPFWPLGIGRLVITPKRVSIVPVQLGYAFEGGSERKAEHPLGRCADAFRTDFQLGHAPSVGRFANGARHRLEAPGRVFVRLFRRGHRRSTRALTIAPTLLVWSHPASSDCPSWPRCISDRSGREKKPGGLLGHRDQMLGQASLISAMSPEKTNRQSLKSTVVRTLRL